MDTILIGNRVVGPGEPCFIIAEAGSNHNGNLEQAKGLITIAADAGADAVKFQTFRARRMYPRSAGTSDYLKLDKSIYDIIAEMEMPYEWLPELAQYASERGIAFLSTPFDEQSVEALNPFVPAFKVASYEMTHLPLVRHMARLGKPLIISTGTANLKEVAETVKTVREAGNNQFVLLQCTASYPTPLDALNVRAMTTMSREFDVAVGLSDHSRDPFIGPLAAVALGAVLIEKHFTYSNELPGPDHRFALEPKELKNMISAIRQIESTLGTGTKVTQPVENELRDFARRSVFTTQAVAQGALFTAENTAALRCGNAGYALPPSAIDRILGKRARRELAAESLIREEDFE